MERRAVVVRHADHRPGRPSARVSDARAWGWIDGIVRGEEPVHPPALADAGNRHLVDPQGDGRLALVVQDYRALVRADRVADGFELETLVDARVRGERYGPVVIRRAPRQVGLLIGLAVEG